MRRGAVLFSLIVLSLSIAPAAASPAAEKQRSAAFDAQVAATKKTMMGDPAKARDLADQALAVARTFPNSPRAQVAIATAQWLGGEARIFLNQTDQAAPLVATALATANRYAAGTKLQGDLLRSRGSVAATQGRVQEALSAFQQAYRVFVGAHEVRSQAIALQDIGQIFEDAGDYERALRYYAQAAETYGGDPALLVSNYNNQAEVLRKLHRPAQAEELYRSALREARLLGGGVLETRILCNLADVQAERGELPAARATIARADALSQSGEAAGWHPFVLGTAGKIASAAHDQASAAAQFDKMFAGVNLQSTDLPYREFHRAASDVYASLHRDDLALAHFKAFQRLNDSARDLTASTSAQLASARFDFANQNYRISTLKAKQLQQEVQLEHQHARLRSILVGTAVVIAAGIFGFLSFALVTGRRSRDRLRGVNSELERALEAKTEFLAMTSHEIRTPLNGILGMTQVMLAEQELQPSVREQIRLVHGAGETMRALVDDILDVAKMESGVIEIVEGDVDVVAMISEVAALWKTQAAAKNVALQMEAVGVPRQVRVDGARLRQIVFNLLSNAVKFTPAGHVHVLCACNEGRLEVRVSDSGIGIAPADQELIFEPFRQADASATRQFGGTGLGLSICRKLAIAMGGDIALASTLGEGSTFTLSLRMVEAVANSAAVTPLEERPDKLIGARVLLMDRNLVAHGMLGAFLEPHVASFTATANFEETSDLVARRAVDHLLVDSASTADLADPTADHLLSLLAVAAHAGVRTSVIAPADSPPILGDPAAPTPDQVILKPISGAALLARLLDLYERPTALAA